MWYNSNLDLFSTQIKITDVVFDNIRYMQTAGLDAAFLNNNDIYEYVAPTLPEFKKAGDLYFDSDLKIVTRYIVDMTTVEKRTIELSWIYTSRNIRVKIDKSFLEGAGNAFVTKILVAPSINYYVSDPESLTGTQYLTVLTDADKTVLISAGYTPIRLDETKPWN